MVGVDAEDVVDSVAELAFVARYRLVLRDADLEVDAASAPSLSTVREVDMVIVIYNPSYRQPVQIVHN